MRKMVFLSVLFLLVTLSACDENMYIISQNTTSYPNATFNVTNTTVYNITNYIYNGTNITNNITNNFTTINNVTNDLNMTFNISADSGEMAVGNSTLVQVVGGTDINTGIVGTVLTIDYTGSDDNNYVTQFNSSVQNGNNATFDIFRSGLSQLQTSITFTNDTAIVNALVDANVTMNATMVNVWTQLTGYFNSNASIWANLYSFMTNFTNLALRVDAENTSIINVNNSLSYQMGQKGAAGNCGSGYAMQNLTNGSQQCIALTGGSATTVTSIVSGKDTVTFCAMPTTQASAVSCQWLNMIAVPSEFGALKNTNVMNLTRQPAVLGNATEFNLAVSQRVVGTAGAKMWVVCGNNITASPLQYLNLSKTGAGIDAATIGNKETGWLPINENCTSMNITTLMASGGNNATDPAWGNIVLKLRYNHSVETAPIYTNQTLYYENELKINRTIETFPANLIVPVSSTTPKEHWDYRSFGNWSVTPSASPYFEFDWNTNYLNQTYAKFSDSHSCVVSPGNCSQSETAVGFPVRRELEADTAEISLRFKLNHAISMLAQTCETDKGDATQYWANVTIGLQQANGFNTSYQIFPVTALMSSWTTINATFNISSIATSTISSDARQLRIWVKFTQLLAREPTIIAPISCAFVESMSVEQYRG